MTRSDTIVKLSAALLRAQKNIGAATKGSANPFFKSKYADLGSVMEACKDALNNEGISVVQPVGNTDGKHTVTTMLLHESGEFMAETMVLEVPKANMQDLGSAISYARRYGLQSFGFIPAEDDDGEKTMVRGKTAVVTDTPPSPPKRTTASFAREAKTALQSQPTPETKVTEASVVATKSVVNGWEN